MTTSVERIVALWNERKAAQSPLITRMGEIRDAYNGDLVVPLPEMERQEKAAVANLIGTGIDKTAMKIASVTPNLWYPAVDPGNRASEKRAAVRRRANLGWWDANKISLKARRRARHLVGYGSSPVILRPDTDLGCARWEVRDPLTAYPAPSPDPDEIAPLNIIFGYQRTHSWLKTNYPDHLDRLHQGKNPQPNDRYDLIEYADDQETVLIAVGQPRSAQEDPRATAPGAGMVELSRVPNRTGMCLAVMPGRVTLDRMMGQFDQLLGPAYQQAKLMALELIAVEKAVFPDTYLVSRQGETAQFLAGPFEGRTGMVNIVKGGEIREVQLQPGYQTGPMIDRLERTQRIGGGIPAEFGGESATNVRTGKRGDAIMAEVIDTTVQEAQEILALSMEAENKRAVAIAKAYFGNQRKTFYVGQAGTTKRVDYTPNKDFETDQNTVTFPMAGADANGLIVGGGQRIGLGTMSKRSFMELDPQVADPQRELDRVQYEALETAVLQSLQQQAATGAVPLIDIANIMQMVVSDKTDIVTAIQKAQEMAQQRQATAVPAGAPETNPGMAMPGMGAEQPVEATTVGAPSGNMNNLAAMLGDLQRSSRPTIPSRVA